MPVEPHTEQWRDAALCGLRQVRLTSCCRPPSAVKVTSLEVTSVGRAMLRSST